MTATDDAIAMTGAAVGIAIQAKAAGTLLNAVDSMSSRRPIRRKKMRQRTVSIKNLGL